MLPMLLLQTIVGTEWSMNFFSLLAGTKPNGRKSKTEEKIRFSPPQPHFLLLPGNYHHTKRKCFSVADK